jgi:heat shock protein HslJ/uncharacterized protein YraI
MKMKTKQIIAIIILLAMVFLVACSGEQTSTAEETQPSTTEAVKVTEAATNIPEPTVIPPTETPTVPELESVPVEEIQDIEWQWTGIELTEPDAAGVIPDPENYTLTFWKENTFSFKADCNVGSGSYQADAEKIKLELGPTTLAECGQDSQYDQYLQHLETVESFAMDGDVLILSFGDDAGQMTFANGGRAEEPALPETCDAGIDPSTVTLDIQGLPYTYQSACVPSTPYDDSQQPGPTGLPDNIQISFNKENQAAQPDDPIIYIIPVDAYKQQWESAGDNGVSSSLDQLQRLLLEGSEPVPVSEIPILPMERVTGVSDLQVQGQYLDITAGSGVRFVTRFIQDPTPVTRENPQMYYTFQGFSDDGLYLISFFYPVSTSTLPLSNAITEEEQERVSSDLQVYMIEKSAELNALSAADWEPVLTTLDALIFSLDFITPFEAALGSGSITNTNWQWAELVEATPAVQAIIPNPQDYTLVFDLDGTLSFKADCNSGMGTYTLAGNQLSIELGVTTLAECAPDSLSNRYMSLLESVEAYALESGRLVLELQEDAGRMIFYNAGPSVSVPDPGTSVHTGTTLEAINVRSGPGTEYPSYGVVARGTTFELTGVSENAEWWVVKISPEIAADGQGWVTAEYVETAETVDVPIVPTPPLDEVQVPAPVPGKPTATALQPINVRAGPGTQYQSYGVAPVGATAEVIGISQDGEWWLIIVSTDVAVDGQAWVNANYVEVVDAQNVPVVPAPPL